MKGAFHCSDARYHEAPPGWDTDQPNPFRTDGTYGAGWSALEICDPDDDRHIYGRSSSGLFRYSLGRHVADLPTRLADCLRYENAHGRQVILTCPPDMDVDALVMRALEDTPEGAILRNNDPQWVVHSARLEAWQSIRECACLKSSSRLKADGVRAHGIGFHEFGEPDDFAEYVMLSGMGAIGPENVVASQAKGRVFTEEHTPYAPGVRLYFDAHKIIATGLGVRDGVHTLKVRGCLPLQTYLMAAATAASIDPQSEVKAWTPRLFLERANAWFEEHVGISGRRNVP